MPKTFEAVYEDGVLRPLQPLDLLDHEHVTLTIDAISASDEDLKGYFTPEEWERALHDTITLEEVRAPLSPIKGRLSQAIIDSREERF